MASAIGGWKNLQLTRPTGSIKTGYVTIEWE